MDRNGDSISENTGGIASFSCILPKTTKTFLERFPAETWQPGDCVITNDPWLATGHLPDFTAVNPIFHQGRLVGFAGCDKTLPGVLMAMARLNCPSVFVYGGAMLPGQWRGKDVTILTAYEGVGAVMTGQMTEAELGELERQCAPTVGSCPGQFTANTMAMVAETLGLALPGSAMMPAVYSERLALARAAGRRVTEILRTGGPLPRDLITRESLENAAAVVAAPPRSRIPSPAGSSMPASTWPWVAARTSSTSAAAPAWPMPSAATARFSSSVPSGIGPPARPRAGCPPRSTSPPCSSVCGTFRSARRSRSPWAWCGSRGFAAATPMKRRRLDDGSNRLGSPPA
jgi:hypothetical protein